MLDHPWIKAVFKNRLALLVVVLLIEAQFFTINMLNTQLRDPHDGWELRISVIDDHLTPNGTWLVPYFVGFFLTALVPIWAMFNMPNKLYRQYVLAIASAALFSYLLYILFPTYVVKPAPDRVPGDGFFAQALRRSYEVDAAASSHNAAPSQHVFYALLNMCFMIRFQPRPRMFWLWVILAALISASTLLTMRHNSPDVISGYLVAVGAYYFALYLGETITTKLGDENDPIVIQGRVGQLYQRLSASRRQRNRQVSTDAV